MTTHRTHPGRDSVLTGLTALCSRGRKFAGAWALAPAAFALALLVACGPESLDDVPPREGVTTVRLEGNRFEPRVIQVAAGTEVTWEWADDGRKHDVAGDGFASPVQAEGTFRHRFGTPGVYDYRCTLHGGMTGRLIVEAR